MTTALASALSPAPIALALRGFECWAASRVLARVAPPCPVEEHPDRFEPTVAEAFNHAGFCLGAAGELTTPEAAFPRATPRDLLVGGFEFSQGQHAGYSKFARELGFAAGLEGETDAPPPSVPGRFVAAFQLGHSEGIAERRDRGESMEGYFRMLADEHEEFTYQRELEHLAREAGGWDRLTGREME